MAFFYIELDGKTIGKYEDIAEFQAVHQDYPNEEPHTTRIFAVHPSHSKYLHIDPVTGRWVYTYEGKRTEY